MGSRLSDHGLESKVVAIVAMQCCSNGQISMYICHLVLILDYTVMYDLAAIFKVSLIIFHFGKTRKKKKVETCV